MTEQEQIFAYKELRNNGQVFVVDTYEDADRIIEALEKQIPKKPFIKKFDNGAEIINCGKCYMCSHITRAVDYCPHCGQKLDWGNEDDRAD